MSYKSTHTGQQIDAGVSAALNPDTTPTANSDALITSGGAKAALDGKQNTLTFDDVPTAGSSNPVKSSGIKSAIDALSTWEDVTSKVTFTLDSFNSRSKFYKCGNLVIAQVQLWLGSTPQASAQDLPAFTVTNDIKPSTIVTSALAVQDLNTGTVIGNGNFWSNSGNTFVASYNAISTQYNMGITGNIIWVI